MIWTSKPVWPPMMAVAVAGALGALFVPFLNIELKETFVIFPSFMFYGSGLALAGLLGFATWRGMMAGMVIVSGRGVHLFRWNRTVTIPWRKLANADERAYDDQTWPEFQTVDGSKIKASYNRFGQADFHRMRTILTEPILNESPSERETRARALLEDYSRDQISLWIVRIYASLLALLAGILVLAL